MTSIGFLLLFFFGPHLLSLIGVCTGSSVPTNDATILKLPTEKGNTYGGGRRLGEQLSKYFERTSGLCPDGTLIGTAEDCEEGAGVLGWSDTTARESGGGPPGPPGCSEAWGDLVFNTETSSRETCSSYSKCLCKLTCPAGTYQDQTGQTTCKSCATDQFSLAGKSSCDYDATTCPKGTFASGTATVCALCVAGKYNDAIGQTSETDCTNCEAGKYFDPALTGQISCKTCESDKEPTGDQKACVIIGEQASKYFQRNSGLCTDVAGGSYIGTPGECVEGAGVLGLSVSDFGAGGSTLQYPPGCSEQSSLWFNAKTSSTAPCTSISKCVCKLTCQAGTYQDQTGQTTCKSCATGQYQNQVEKSSCKDDCGAGSYITADKTACSVCNLGQYQDQDDNFSCKDDCGAGSYINSDKTACDNCPAGFYQNEDDRTICKDDCDAGSYITADKGNCSVCDSGQYQDQDDQPSCKTCPTGYYNSLTGQSACLPLPTCDDIDGSNTNFFSCVNGINHLKDSLDSVTCATETCVVNDCCEPNPTCGDIDGFSTTFQQFTCPLDHTIKAVLTDVVCTTETCASVDCCVLNAKCNSVLSNVTTFCSSGELVSNAAFVTCGGIACTKSNDGEKCCKPVTTTTAAVATPSSVDQESFFDTDSLSTATIITIATTTFVIFCTTIVMVAATTFW
jgi:hypothetical protein